LSDNDLLILTYLNQHCFNIYFTDQDYHNLLETRVLYYLDGIGIYFALRLFGYKDVERFNASDINAKILSFFCEKETKVFLIGGRFTPEQITNNTNEQRLNVCGYQNGYFNESEKVGLLENIKDSGAQAVVIGMGVPAQEILALEISNNINVNMILCVGEFLEYYFGTKRRIPKSLRNIGIEWLFRLIKEPGRLWKRYIIGIPIFIIRIIQLRFTNSRLT
jgi:N-acetylglucosaminyldiphosphoundecaprenol N-acetyl-beta-D-mannosaminyltransferase